MKLLLISVYMSLDFSLLRGQQRIEESQHILLRFSFPSFYNNYIKFCCKLYPGGCYMLLDSAGYTCDHLRGRVTKREEDGWIEFQISNVHMANAGYYRCAILGAQKQIYSDYYIEVFEASDSSRPAVMSTIIAPKSSTTIPDSSAAVLAQDHSDNIRAPWSFGLPLVVVVSIAVVVFVTAVITIVCYKVKVRCKNSDISGETLRESVKREAPETSGIVYTTVNFRPHQPEGVYANLELQRGTVPDMECAGMVEYSTLAVQV